MDYSNETKDNNEAAHSILKNEISDLCADFVSYDKYGPGLKKVLVSKSGEWHELIKVSNDVEFRIKLEPYYNKYNSILLTWLEYPEDHTDFCVVLFFIPDLIWSYTAVCNRKNNLAKF